MNMKTIDIISQMNKKTMKSGGLLNLHTDQMAKDKIIMNWIVIKRFWIETQIFNFEIIGDFVLSLTKLDLTIPRPKIENPLNAGKLAMRICL